MKKALKSMKWLMLISGILVVILGITMLFTPLSNLVALAIFIGISMLISGISEIMSFCGEEKGHRSGWMLVSGILSTLFGIWTMFGRGTEALVAILPFIFAVWVMSSGITRIVGSVSLKSEGSSLWGWMLAFGILGTVFGFLLLFSPVLSGMIVSYALAFMLISGISEIISFCGEEKGHHSVWMLVSGILSTLFGIWTMFGRGTEALVAFLPFIFAVWVMSSGITRIVGAVSLKSEGSSLWGWMLAFGILGTVFGFLLLFSPVLSGMMISYALAFMLISHGVNNIIIFFHMNKIGNHIREHLGE